MASVHHTSMSGLGVRWAVPADLPDLVAIELQSNAYPWQVEDFHAAMGCRSPLRVPFVVEPEAIDRVLGHAVVALHLGHIEIETLAVHKDFRRMKVATCLVLQTVKLLRRGRWTERDRVVVRVPEVDLDRQLFYKRMGFRAIATLRGSRDDRGLVRYLMQLKL